ncbi:MAG: glycosyltransferase family 2 protein [Candidatus Hodarchaeales archaeon]
MNQNLNSSSQKPQNNIAINENPPKLKISFVIPALNEEMCIMYTLQKLPLQDLRKKGLDTEVLVIDNGSEDNTVELAKKEGAKVLIEPNRGYGNAYRRGFRKASGDIIVMTDADGTYPVEKTYRHIKPILENEADVVLGSRFKGKIENGAMSIIHKIGNKILTFQMNLLFSRLTTDAHSGFRAFSTKALRSLNLTTSGMEFASELVIECARKKLRVIEIPIRYRKRAGGSIPKIRTIRDGLRHFVFMLKFKAIDIKKNL